MASQNKIRILVVEHSASVITTLKRILLSKELQLFQLTVVPSLTDAYQILEEQSFDIALVNFYLSDSLGLESLDDFKRASPRLPVIAITDSTDPQFRLDAIKRGAQDCISFMEIRDEFVKYVILFVVQRDRLQKYLLESEQHFHMMADTAPVFIWMTDRDGEFSFFNKPWLEFLGRTIQQELGRGWMEGMHAEDIEIASKRIASAFRRRKSFRIEFRMKAADGSYRWMLDTGIPRYASNGNYLGFIGSCIDITEIKEAQQKLNQYKKELEREVNERTSELKEINKRLSQEIKEHERTEKELKTSQKELRNLSAYLQKVREKERAVLAREIHDELGQLLTALKMDLSWFSYKIPPQNEDLIHKTKVMDEIIDRTIKTVQKICVELRPSILDDLGFVAALQWQAEEFKKHSRIQCDLSIDPEEIELDSERSTALFRVFQETLTNVARHADATEVKVSFEERADGIFLEVVDNGKGIPPDKIFDSKSFGLMGMRERLFELSGDIEIKGEEHKGTMVRVCLPNKKGA